MPRMGLNRHRRGYATKEAGSAVRFPVSGPIGLARSQFLNLPNSSSLNITSCTSAIFKILFYCYRYYSTKHSIRSYASYQGSSRSLVKQSYLMHLGIEQILLTEMHRYK